MAILDAAERIRLGRRGLSRCPLHEDRHPSLSVSFRADGSPLVNCFACHDGAGLARHFALGGRRAKVTAIRPGPRPTFADALEEVMAARTAALGYRPPTTGHDRRLAADLAGKTYTWPLHAWEGDWRDNDPAWPVLVERRLREVLAGRRLTQAHVDEALRRAALDFRELAVDSMTIRERRNHERTRARIAALDAEVVARA